jgi:hypothetical protein
MGLQGPVPDGTGRSPAPSGAGRRRANHSWKGGPFPYYYIVGEVIPDGQGGLLASWAKVDNFANVPQGMMSHVSGGSPTTNTMPYMLDPMILGDNGTAFASVNDPIGVNQPLILAFDVNSAAVQWTYQQPVTSLALVAASDGGGVVAKSTSSGVDTVIRLDANGQPTIDPLTGSGLSYMYSNMWLSPPSGQPLSGIMGNPILFALSPLPVPVSPPAPKINLNVFQITGTTVNSNDSISSQIQKAVKVWGNLIPAVQLTWNSQVTPGPACDPTKLPTGYTCANTPEASLANYDAPSGCASSIGWLVLTTRWPNAPSPTNRGAKILFTNTITPEGLFNFYDTAGEVPFYDRSLCPNGGIGNDVVMSNLAYNYVLAHEIGHVFGLIDLNGKAAANATGNLMCHDPAYCPDIAHQGTFLNSDQVATAMRALFQWIP